MEGNGTVFMQHKVNASNFIIIFLALI